MCQNYSDEISYISKTGTVFSTGSGNNCYIDESRQTSITLNKGQKYWFDQSDASNASHPLCSSTTVNEEHESRSEYTTGIAGAYATKVYIYCSNHSAMRLTINVRSGGSFALELRKDVRAALIADSNVTTLLSTRIYDEPPQNVTYSFVRFSDLQRRSTDTTSSTNTEVIFNVEACS